MVLLLVIFQCLTQHMTHNTSPLPALGFDNMVYNKKYVSGLDPPCLEVDVQRKKATRPRSQQEEGEWGAKGSKCVWGGGPEPLPPAKLPTTCVCSTSSTKKDQRLARNPSQKGSLRPCDSASRHPRLQ